MKPLTDKNRRVLKAIEQMIAERQGLSPTIRDIMYRLQFRSTFGVTRHLHVLEQHGKIIWERGCARGILLPSHDEKSKLLAKIATFDVEVLRGFVACQ